MVKVKLLLDITLKDGDSFEGQPKAFGEEALDALHVPAEVVLGVGVGC